MIKEIKSAVKDDICFYAIIIATPYERCLFNNSQRERKVPKEIIKRMYYHFEPPAAFEEGFSHCVLELSCEVVDLNVIKKDSYEISHDNPHHSLTIGEHMNSVYFYMSQFLLSNKLDDNECKNRDCNLILLDAAKWHDIGKVETKTFRDGIAHYYNHQNVGAYLYLCSEEAYHNDYLAVANLIYHHMDFFDEKKIEKDKAFWPEKFMVMLSLLHAADVKSTLIKKEKICLLLLFCYLFLLSAKWPILPQRLIIMDALRENLFLFILVARPALLGLFYYLFLLDFFHEK